MRILAIDYGDRHLGLALSDPFGMFAQPLETYTLKDRKADNAAYFRGLVAAHDIGRFVVGMPFRMDGTPGTRAEKTKEFARWLEGVTKLPVVFWDERLTTQQATAIMREQGVKQQNRKSVENQIAAALILQAYLNGQTVETPDPRHS